MGSIIHEIEKIVILKKNYEFVQKKKTKQNTMTNWKFFEEIRVSDNFWNVSKCAFLTTSDSDVFIGILFSNFWHIFIFSKQCWLFYGNFLNLNILSIFEKRFVTFFEKISIRTAKLLWNFFKNFLTILFWMIFDLLRYSILIIIWHDSK